MRRPEVLMATILLAWFSYLSMFLRRPVDITTTAYRFSVQHSPNILLVLVDDMDKTLGSWMAMPKLEKYLIRQGITFDNAFVTTPVCCPSRSSILTGMYAHNHRTTNNSVEGNCASQAWYEGPEKKSFAVSLQALGYKTYYAGKYLNKYATRIDTVERVPTGWDEWFGLAGNSRYYNYTLSNNGVKEDHGDTYPDDYLTELISKKGVQWINEHTPYSPFLMVLSTPAVHSRFIPASKYQNLFQDTQVPRWPSFNKIPTNHSWLVSDFQNGLTERQIALGDGVMRNRLQCLQSVDDLIEDVVQALDSRKMLENTYIMFMSDHGYHIGQHGMWLDKRMMYESDIRIPMVVRGPLIPQNVMTSSIALNIDIAPTFLTIAGARVPKHMDGRSLLPILTSKKPPDDWRIEFLVEYFGEGQRDTHVKTCGPDIHNVADSLYVCDAWNNTYKCLRSLPPETHQEQKVTPADMNSLNFFNHDVLRGGYKHCKFYESAWTDEVYLEMLFNITEDAFELRNAFHALKRRYDTTISSMVIQRFADK